MSLSVLVWCIVLVVTFGMMMKYIDKGYLGKLEDWTAAFILQWECEECESFSCLHVFCAMVLECRVMKPRLLTWNYSGWSGTKKKARKEKERGQNLILSLLTPTNHIGFTCVYIKGLSAIVYFSKGLLGSFLCLYIMLFLHVIYKCSQSNHYSIIVNKVDLLVVHMLISCLAFLM